jgi:DNA polymerase-3 subunit alpha
VLLAENEVGYKNLSYLNSMGYLEGFYYNPRVDKALLRERHEGIIAMSACLGGEVAQTLEKHGIAGRGRGGRARVPDIFGRATSSSS